MAPKTPYFRVVYKDIMCKYLLQETRYKQMEKNFKTTNDPLLYISSKFDLFDPQTAENKLCCVFEPLSAIFVWRADGHQVATAASCCVSGCNLCVVLIVNRKQNKLCMVTACKLCLVY